MQQIKNDNYNLQRFRKEQEIYYETAFEEIKEGFKQSHWMWFIFPQLKGLGITTTSNYYGISTLQEAQAYLEDEYLNNNLRKICIELLKHDISADEIFGYPDVLKLNSCMTLFANATKDNKIFIDVINKFYNGEQDKLTLRLLNISIDNQDYYNEKLENIDKNIDKNIDNNIDNDKKKIIQENTKKKIILTGGGTAGHITPNIALIPRLQDEGYEIYYIGSYDGMEKGLIMDCNIPYYGISTGKFRRYASLKNISDPFKVLNGIKQARQLIKEINPDVIFSKGGFVSVPVVLAAKTLNVPTIIHESDMSPGLANKISLPFATKICCTFPETMEVLPKEKAILSGSPIREELLMGDKNKAKEFVGFKDNKPVVLVMGGSLGSVAVNEAVRGVLDKLLETFNIIHICGKEKIDENYNNIEGYVQYEYIKDELKNMFALSDIIISRAGANAICEILALQKPNILIPLPKKISRGDQLLNAESFRKLGYSEVLDEDTITNDLMYDTIMKVYNNKEQYINTMINSEQNNAIEIIINLIKKVNYV